MSNSVLPTFPGLTWENTKAPGFSTKIQISVGGSEVRAGFMPYPIRSYELKHEMLRSYGAYTELNTLYGFFCSRQGALDSFLYNDPEDNTIAAQSIGAGDGVTVAFQLGRTLGGFFEPIYNTNAAPQIFVNGVLKTVGVDYTVSAGLVTFTVAPGSGLPITWTGTYYWRCRFEDDQLSFSEFANLFWKQDGLKFRTLLNA